MTPPKPTLQRIAEALFTTGIACLLLAVILGIVGGLAFPPLAFVSAGLSIPGIVLLLLGYQLK